MSAARARHNVWPKERQKLQNEIKLHHGAETERRARTHKVANIITLCTNVKRSLMARRIQNFVSYLVKTLLTSVLLVHVIHFFYPDIYGSFYYISLCLIVCLPIFVFPTMITNISSTIQLVFLLYLFRYVNVTIPLLKKDTKYLLDCFLVDNSVFGGK